MPVPKTGALPLGDALSIQIEFYLRLGLWTSGLNIKVIEVEKQIM
jgi:hypothetical protein